VGVRRSRDSGQRRRCGFNALLSAGDRRGQDEALPKDEAEAASSSWLHGKEVGHDATA
jgi:hypothetical protein